MKKCSICGKYFNEWGNNAQPVNDGTCCDNCNRLIVIPRRWQDIENRKEREADKKEKNENIDISNINIDTVKFIKRQIEKSIEHWEEYKKEDDNEFIEGALGGLNAFRKTLDYILRKIEKEEF